MTTTDSQQKPLLRRVVARTKAVEERQASSEWECVGPHPRVRRERGNAFLSFCKIYFVQCKHKKSDNYGPQRIPRGKFRTEENIFLVCGHTKPIRKFLMNEKFPTNLKNSLPLPEEFPNTVDPAFQNRS